mmetsp:Transcript_30990/g.71977  ORF Transcript_30990/g.71977 Transcript_30990/m.71977 type:complete len:382 (+) Transcript_30990:65-1210(+)
MIKYNGTIDLLTKMEGSVLPFALAISLPCMILSGLIKHAEVNSLADFDEFRTYFKIKNSAYRAFSALLGFLIVFRTSQAYARYWDGGGLMQQMIGSWFDAASSAVAFCHGSKADGAAVVCFQHLLLRLYSILTALALTELRGDDVEPRPVSFEVIDAESFDSETSRLMKDSPCKIELIYHWIQTVLVDANATGIITVAPPILARAFFELADGMVKFHDCKKIAVHPFPFPYSQVTLILLISHWIITPVMICSETQNTFLACLFSFLVVFIFWGLYAIAIELENPFGDDPNDLDGADILREMNSKLLMLFVSPAAKAVPSLLPGVSTEQLDQQALECRVPLHQLWSKQKLSVPEIITMDAGFDQRIVSSSSTRPLLSTSRGS